MVRRLLLLLSLYRNVFFCNFLLANIWHSCFLLEIDDSTEVKVSFFKGDDLSALTLFGQFTAEEGRRVHHNDNNFKANHGFFFLLDTSTDRIS